MSASCSKEDVASKKAAQTLQARESFVFFLGDAASGKTTAIRRFLHPSKLTNDKEATRHGLNYTFARKFRSLDTNLKDIAHIWELSGPRTLTSELSHIDNIFLTPKQVTTAVAVIVLDLSKPGDCFESGLYWLTVVKNRLQTVYSKLQLRGSKLPEQLVAREKKNHICQHKDREQVYNSGIQIILLGNKFDQFLHHQEVDKRKVLIGGLRYLAHCHGAHFLCTGELSEESKTSKIHKNVWKECLDGYRSLLTHLAFYGFEKRLTSFKHPIQREHALPLLIIAGKDDVDSIGLPPISSTSSKDVPNLNLWEETISNCYAPSTTQPSYEDLLQEDQFHNEGDTVLRFLLNGHFVCEELDAVLSKISLKDELKTVVQKH